MKGQERKTAIAAYKERKIEVGIYAVRCTTSAQVWVGSAPDLATIQNRLWFTLRHACNPHRSLQEPWTAHGSEAFTFEVVERLTDDGDLAYIRNAALKNLLAHWTARLDGTRI